MTYHLVAVARLFIMISRWHRGHLTLSSSKTPQTSYPYQSNSLNTHHTSYQNIYSSQFIQAQAKNMSKFQEMTISEPSTPVEVTHNVRPTLTARDNTLHASQQVDSTAPEGGYGWVIVFACFSIGFWIVGTLYSWGVMQAALFKRGLSSPPTLSWIGSLAFACIAIFALVNARVIRWLGAKVTALLGISLLALGEILSGSFTHNVGGLFVTAGALSGIGTRYDSDPFYTKLMY